MKLRVGLIFFTWIFLFSSSEAIAQQERDSLLNQTIKLSKKKGTVYEFLKEISAATGYLFIYDSQSIQNEQATTLAKKEDRLESLIHAIVQVPITIEVKERYLILKPAEEDLTLDPLPKGNQTYLVKGKVIDQYTREPLPFATVSVEGSSVGTITNENGEFRLAIPDTHLHSTIIYSYLGYKSQHLRADLLLDMQALVLMTPTNVSMQEVVIRYANPLSVLQEYRIRKEDNYSNEPVYLTTFYREGRRKKKRFVDLTEAVFKVYKRGVYQQGKDHLKLYKMQNYTNLIETDSFITKLKSGIDASLMLDVVKQPLDFLLEGAEEEFNFSFVDINDLGERQVFVIGFEQKEGLNEPRYRGRLYFDTENYAMVQAEFEMHPRHVKSATPIFVVQRSGKMRVNLKKVKYIVSYKQWGDHYYINHVRGELALSVKKKNWAFASSTAEVFFEMLTGRIQTEDVTPLQRNDRLQTRTVFSEVDYPYDYDFWEDYNVIEPEEDIQEALQKVALKIEQIEE